MHFNGASGDGQNILCHAVVGPEVRGGDVSDQQDHGALKWVENN